jgi:hypothetical protein
VNKDITPGLAHRALQVARDYINQMSRRLRPHTSTPRGQLPHAIREALDRFRHAIDRSDSTAAQPGPQAPQRASPAGEVTDAKDRYRSFADPPRPHVLR